MIVGAVLQAEEVPIGHPIERIAHHDRDSQAAELVIHADILALLDFGARIAEVRPEKAVIVVAQRQIVDVVDHAIAVRVLPQLAIAVDVRPVVEQEAPTAVGIAAVKSWAGSKVSYGWT